MGKFLDKTQKQQLEDELRRERGRKHADRIRIILLLDQGKTYASIAEYLFLDESTIANYRRRYKEGGLEDLLNDDHKGSASRLCLDDQMKLMLHLQENIYLNVNSILSYVSRRFGVQYKLSGLTHLLHRMGFSYKKPKSIPGKAKIEEQRAFIALYEELKPQGKIYFGDAVHPMHNPVLGYGWIQKGVEVEIPSNAGRDRINVVGALCLDGLDVITRSFDTVNAQAMTQILVAIREKNPGVKNLYYILDNARYNRSKQLKAKAEELGIQLVYLPPYSPNLNPIERLWKFFKKMVMYNSYYKEFSKFKKAVSSFFQGLRGHRDELTTLLTDNFRPVGT